ncbi:MBL fold metallo-hydrolase [Rhizobium laguerreae]|uniref:MBL fold metallo-hydrolase n=1 Tax=Rhizobium laguerreae TaxID=1076926 RepID=A0AB35FNH3_9HYPH|nr:MBL fold metallo-hydrolase [Rhizobium laguerreae]MBY3068219.1 MBL fold metallo-hydrolase [Rhizobium laguerreae]MBY3082079.1 MBL fold metallo-hydrolase [Rhizobium laguerreae]MBY3110488.1 MBL fold metallo-hydrolase [Rhizobium laguerreae]
MTNLSRRAFAFAIPAVPVALGSALAASVNTAKARTADPKALVPSAQIRIGRFTVTALVDGFADMPFGYFPGNTPEQVEEEAKAISTTKPGGIRFMFNQYLVDDGERLILIDTGPAGAMGKTGQLPGALETMGITREDIGAVIVTHMHVDHIGGLVAGGSRSFPNSDVYVDRRDVAYWTDPAKRISAPEFLKPSFDASLELVRLYPNLQAMDGERQITPGVSIIDLTGHTPGHIGVRIEDGGQSLLMVSDMLFPVVHPLNPKVGFLFEQDRSAAQIMRERFFPRAAAEKALVAATHMPFPGLGRIVAEGGKMRWIPAEWAYQE